MQPTFVSPSKHNITGCILAGGQGSRMGGVDKGLLMLQGQTLVQRAIERLQPQVNSLMVNANRHASQYAVFGIPVVADADHGFKGPLAGFLSGLQHCPTDWLVTVPCDSPFFPLGSGISVGSCCRAIQCVDCHGTSTRNHVRWARRMAITTGV
jgi:molybdopterin-guanine dinucleotide biosynthesis protein A